MNNNTPSSITTSIISPPEALTKNPPAAKTGSTFVVGSTFSAPATNAACDSHSYAFTYNNATFVLIDQFDTSDKGTAAGGQAKKSSEKSGSTAEKSGDSGEKSGKKAGAKKAGGGGDRSSIARQQSWITSTLQASKAAGHQAFVFGHKKPLGR